MSINLSIAAIILRVVNKPLIIVTSRILVVANGLASRMVA
jgi:hypothetical protein